MVTKVLELRNDLGLIVEVNEGAPGKPNDMVFWLQYKNNEGQWAYKGSNGATGIRIPLTNGLDKFLIDAIKAGKDASDKFVATKPQATAGINANALNSLSDADKIALLQALQASLQPKLQAQEPVLSLETLLTNTKKGGKNSKK